MPTLKGEAANNSDARTNMLDSLVILLLFQNNDDDVNCLGIIICLESSSTSYLMYVDKNAFRMIKHSMQVSY
jgi:hypothetical protein